MSDRVLVLRRSFAGVTPEEMYDAWTRPELVAAWYGPEGFSNTVHEMDLRVGGRYRLTMHAPDGSDYPLSGTFSVLDRPRRLGFTWRWETAPPEADSAETRVTVDIKAAGTATEIVLTHEGFADVEAVRNHETGWTGALERLARRLSRP